MRGPASTLLRLHRLIDKEGNAAVRHRSLLAGPTSSVTLRMFDRDIAEIEREALRNHRSVSAEIRYRLGLSPESRSTVAPDLTPVIA